MRIYHDIKRIGLHDTIHILQQALTFVYEDYLFEPEVTLNMNTFIAVYKRSYIKICRNISIYELEHLNITLEEFALRIKSEIISQYRYKLDEIYNGRFKC